MARGYLDDLNAFTRVARQGSFTRAAAELGVSPSALSQTVRAFEERLGLRLLRRSTRSVSPTDAGQRLLLGVGQHLEEIQRELTAIGDLRDRPAGRIRISAPDHAAQAVLWPLVDQFLPQFPDIQVEITVDDGIRDVVAEGYDAGVRLHGTVAKDMIAVSLTDRERMIVVGAPAYLERHRIPKQPADLTQHICISFRLATHGEVYAWEFRKGDEALSVRVEGQLVFNSLNLIHRAVLAGHGLACLPETNLKQAIQSGALIPVLDD